MSASGVPSSEPRVAPRSLAGQPDLLLSSPRRSPGCSSVARSWAATPPGHRSPRQRSRSPTTACASRFRAAGRAETVANIPGFRDPLRLRNGADGLRASAEQLPATSATLLPAAFLATLEGAPERPTLVRVTGGHSALRYRVPGRNGSITLVYAAPNTKGIATVACTSRIEPRASCGRATRSPPRSRCRRALPLAPSASAAFFSRAPAVLSDLDAVRTKGLKALGAASRARGQALAADGLGRAHKGAAASLAPLASGGGVPRATVGALTATATAYAALARAARNRLPGPYADAGRGVTTANADLRRPWRRPPRRRTARPRRRARRPPVRKPSGAGHGPAAKTQPSGSAPRDPGQGHQARPAATATGASTSRS